MEPRLKTYHLAKCVSQNWFVGWSLTSFFSTNTAILETRDQG